ncbi:DNA mismatch repair protein MutS, core [Sergentomyia squamirostris]
MDSDSAPAAGEENLLEINEDLSEEVEHILSMSWDSSIFSAAFYVVQTMEMFIVNEIPDLRPTFSYTQNLFRQLNPVAIVASGHEAFLRVLMTLLKYPEDVHPRDYVATINTGEQSKFLVYPQSEKIIQQNRERVFRIPLAGFETEDEKKAYLDTLIAPHHKLVFHSMGNLLRFMETPNWQSMQDKPNPPVFTSLKVFSLKNQVLIDDSSYMALEIFTTISHPSGFKHGSKESELVGFSLFRLFNCCQSKLGTNELKVVLQQPTNDVSVLMKRLDTIEWCLEAQNSITVGQLKKLLRNVYEISRCYKKIREHPNKIYFWGVLRTSLTKMLRICEICREIARDSERCGILRDLRDILEENVELFVVFLIINDIMDMEESVESNRFVPQVGVDQDLDDLRDLLQNIQSNVPEAILDEIRQVFTTYDSCQITFIPEIGFLVAVKSEMQNLAHSSTSCDTTSTQQVKFVFHTKDTYYYSAAACAELNDKYGHVYNDICVLEQQMCQRVVDFLGVHIEKLQNVSKLCAKLDCFMGMSAFLMSRKYVRPVLSTEKVIQVDGGRHALMDECTNFIANDVHISLEKENLITIITAPNAAGKSIYLKQVGIIVYLAHIGCYVPATSAKIGIIDSIYSRIHSTEAIHQESSSFLYDLHQMSRAMMESSNRSLILIDEFGCGTNLNEGKSLLVACLEELSKRGSLAPIAIFSTHFLDIVDLCQVRTVVREITIQSVFNDNGRLQSTYRIVNGRCPAQYAAELHNIRRSEEGQRLFTPQRVKGILDKR